MPVVRPLGYLAAALLSPFFLVCSALLLAVQDLCFQLFGKRDEPSHIPVNRNAVSIVIPTWDGLDLLQRYLPSVLKALDGNQDHEVIVVDNASSDGTAEYLRQHFPQVRVLAQKTNLGFGGGSNAGFRAAQNDIVVLLNNDMRVEPDFLVPLLEPFADPQVFAVACQIFLSDPTKRREETGLTETWWQSGRLAASHRIDPQIQSAFPCAYPGGGSSAFDRRKFLELGGFNEIFRPFYYEDTDLGFLAWKRGWKVLYQPRSVVFHEHRGTIGRRFDPARIDRVIQLNVLLFAWKNIHDWRMLASNFWHLFLTALPGSLLGKRRGFHTAAAISFAIGRLPELLRKRWRARTLACIDDREAFLRQKGAYFRDRFDASLSQPKRPQILFLSPYPIEPPTHGGAVFMRETIRALSTYADVHLLCFVERSSQIPPHEALQPFCASTEFVVRKPSPGGTAWYLLPRTVREFADPEFSWAMHRILFLRQIDVVQIDYAMLAQYHGSYKCIPCFLFEHDLAFQSIFRQLASTPRVRDAIAYMQLLRFELRMTPRFARVQVCSEDNKRYLLQFVPELQNRVDADQRAVIDTSAYRYVSSGREPNSVLFIGSFDHYPNIQALDWILSSVWPEVMRQNPNATLYIAGSGSSEPLRRKLSQPGVKLLGFVPDIHALLAQKAALMCPILSGSGVRVKLLESFASGIPVVSTRLGAEGLAQTPGEFCELADTPEDFSQAILRLLSDPAHAAAMAQRARKMVEEQRDSATATRKLVAAYWQEITKRRPESTPPLELPCAPAARGTAV